MFVRRTVFNDFDRTFNGFFGGTWGAVPAQRKTEDDSNEDRTPQLTPAVESYTRNGKLVLRAEMPGVSIDSVKVTAENGRLTLVGEKSFERTDDQSEFLVRETRYGRFERTFVLPEFVDSNDVAATMTDGVLEISMPLPEKPAARQIPVQLADGGKNKAA